MRSPESIRDSLDIYAMISRSQISKHGALSFFFKFFMKSCCHAHDWPTKRQFCQNYTLLWAKKVNRMPFFFRFITKNSMLSCPYFVKTSILKKHTALITSILLKTLCSHDILFKNFHKNPILSCSYLVKKRQFC